MANIFEKKMYNKYRINIVAKHFFTFKYKKLKQSDSFFYS